MTEVYLVKSFKIIFGVGFVFSILLILVISLYDIQLINTVAIIDNENEIISSGTKNSNVYIPGDKEYIGCRFDGLKAICWASNNKKIAVYGYSYNEKYIELCKAIPTDSFIHFKMNKDSGEIIALNIYTKSFETE